MDDPVYADDEPKLASLDLFWCTAAGVALMAILAVWKLADILRWLLSS